MEKVKTKDTLLLIDANSLVHRAFHALPPLTTPDNKPSGALYGLASMLIKIMRERPPGYAAAAFDRQELTHRAREYKEYKATRAPIADELIFQLAKAHELFEKFQIKTFEKAGWEADDIIATFSEKFRKEGLLQIVILSGDLDMLQAVRDKKVVAEIPKRGISDTVVYDKDAVIDRFGIPPEKMADYKGLVGDKSDNIPGVPGIGPKTAEKVLKNHATLEDLYKDIKEIGMSDEKLRNKLLEFEEQALLSKKLATLDFNAPVIASKEELRINLPLESMELEEFIKKLGFESLLRGIVKARGVPYNEGG